MEFDMVFEGGGAKGIAFLGALAELERRGHWPCRIVGTSAGAIFASLLAAGYDAASLHAAVSRRDAEGVLLLNRFNDVPPPFTEQEFEESFLGRSLARLDFPLLPQAFEARIDRLIGRAVMSMGWSRQAFCFVEYGGIYLGEEFVRWLQALLDDRHPGLGQATLKEFNAHTGRDLSLVAADTAGRLMLVLNHRTAPELPVAIAVRMSMSIPLVWKELLWKKEWGTYLGRDLSGHSIVDGGVLSNFPMQLIATTLAEVVEVMGETDPYRVPNLGFLIDEQLSHPDFDPVKEESGLLAGPQRRLTRLWQAIIGSRDQLVIERCLQNREVCRLPAAGYGVTEFDMTERRFELLVRAGQEAASQYFDQRGV